MKYSSFYKNTNDKEDEVYFLRQHLLKIIKSGKISPFPRIDTNDNASIIVENHVPKNPIPERTNEQIEKDELNTIKSEVRTSYKHITDQTIAHVCKLIESKTNKQYKFYSSLEINGDFAKHLKNPVTNRNDIQVFFIPGSCPNSIGHWICIHYIHRTNTVEVYDSINSKNELSKMHAEATKIFYTSRKKKRNIVYRTVKNTEADISSCGIYALVYAITLASGKKPENINYHINKSTNTKADEVIFLREHLLKIIETGIISEFPEMKKE